MSLRTVSLEEAQGGTTWLLHGHPGSGKTTLAGSLGVLGKVAYLDVLGDRGSKVLIGAPGWQNIAVSPIDTLQDMEDALRALEQEDTGEYVGVVLDSATALQSMAVNAVLNAGRTKPREVSVTGAGSLDQRGWGVSASVMKLAVERLLALASVKRQHPMHVVIISQTKRTIDDVTGETVLTPSVQPALLESLTATPDYLVTTRSTVNAKGQEMHTANWGCSQNDGIKRRLRPGLRYLPRVIGDGTDAPDALNMHTLIWYVTDAPDQTESGQK